MNTAPIARSEKEIVDQALVEADNLVSSVLRSDAAVHRIALVLARTLNDLKKVRSSAKTQAKVA